MTFDRILLRPFRANPVVDIIYPGRRVAARRGALPWAMAVSALRGVDQPIQRSPELHSTPNGQLMTVNLIAADLNAGW